MGNIFIFLKNLKSFSKQWTVVSTCWGSSKGTHHLVLVLSKGTHNLFLDNWVPWMSTQCLSLRHRMPQQNRNKIVAPSPATTLLVLRSKKQVYSATTITW